VRKGESYEARLEETMKTLTVTGNGKVTKMLTSKDQGWLSYGYPYLSNHSRARPAASSFAASIVLCQWEQPTKTVPT
jgi:hypothetical protein